MSKGVNQSFVKGGLTKNPELRYTQNRTAFLSFTLACGYSVNRNGEWQEETDYVLCKAWGNKAEAIAKYCGKGYPLLVIGSIKTDKYEGKDGKTQYITYVLVQDVQFCGGKRDNDKDGEKWQNPDGSMWTQQDNGNWTKDQPQQDNVNMSMKFSDGPAGMNETADIPF